MHAIDEVVQSVLAVREGWKKYGIDQRNWYFYKQTFKSGKMEHETKRKIAEAGGYRFAQPERWVSHLG